MNFSTKTEYGLRALACLDKKAETAISLAVIAEKEGLSLAYLERLFASLKKAGLVRSTRGKSGGYCLARPAGQINLLEVVEALEGRLLPYDCVKGGVCKHQLTCRVHPVWAKIYTHMAQTLRNIKLSKLM